LQISSGAASKKTEEQIWEQQRIVTQLKVNIKIQPPDYRVLQASWYSGDLNDGLVQNSNGLFCLEIDHLMTTHLITRQNEPTY
jgi:hypothetical protein